VSGSGTWSWNGADWSGPAALPPFNTGGHNFTIQEVVTWWDPGQARYLAWDPYPNQLFAWNGTGWTSVTPPAATAGDDTFAACGGYSRDEGGYVRFGGCFNFACNVPEGGTRNTTTWLTPASALALTPGTQPAARTRATMADFRDQAVAWLIRGIGTSVDAYGDDWSWDGRRWLQRGTSSPNISYVDVPLGYLSPSRLVQYGGTPIGPSGYYGPASTSVLTAPGTTWGGGTVAPNYTEPDGLGGTALGDQALTWDPGHGLVYFGSTARHTWVATWISSPSAGVLWTDWTGASSPPSVKGHRMAYCAGAAGVVLFGGVTGAGALLDQTWRWNGAWLQLSPATRPPARTGAVMFCDERRNKLLMFGGAGASGPLGDLWQFDGTTWTALSPTLLPDARGGAAGAFLSALGRGVVFGGAGSALQGDTWDVDGGRDRRPAHLFHASFAAAATGPATVTGVGASWKAMASSSFPDPGPSYLADLLVRDGDVWRNTLASNIAGAPLTWSTETDPAWTSLPSGTRATRLRALLGGDRLDLSFAATPHGTNDQLTPGATLDSTYVEASVRYRLACLAAGATTTTSQRCCSGAAFAGTCQ
jgi:hypothetical protein